MADKDLTLRLRLNWSEASRESRRFHAEEQARLNQYQQAFDRHFKQGKAGADDQTSAMQRLGSAAERAGESVKSMALGYAGIGAVVGGIRLVSDVLAQVSANALKAGEASFAMESRLRALAALTSSAEKPGGLTVRDMVGYTLKTGMSVDEAEKFQTAFFGSSPAGLQKGNVTQAQLDSAVVQAGIMAKRQGGDMKVRGDLAGVLGQFKKYAPGEKGVTEMMGDLEKVRIGLGEGRGEDPELTASLLNLAGSLVGEGKMFPNVAELASHLGTQSLSAAGLKSDVRTEQAMRGMSGTTDKTRKWLKEFADINETDNAEVRQAKLFPKLQAEKDKGRTVMGFLQEKLENYEQARAITELMEVSDVQKARMAKTRGGATPEAQAASTLAVGEKVLEENRAFMASPGGRFGAGKAAVEGAEAITGKEFEDWTQTKEWAKAAYFARKKHLSIDEGFKGIAAGVMTRLNPFAGKEARQEEIALEALQQQVEAAGLTDVVARRTPGTLANWERGGAEKGFFAAEPHERGRIMSEELRKAGIVPGANLDAEVTALLKEQNGMMKDEKNATPRPLPGGKPIEVGRSN